MFATPEWERDVPNSNVNFGKKVSHKKYKYDIKTESKQNETIQSKSSNTIFNVYKLGSGASTNEPTKNVKMKQKKRKLNDSGGQFVTKMKKIDKVLPSIDNVESGTVRNSQLYTLEDKTSSNIKIKQNKRKADNSGGKFVTKMKKLKKIIPSMNKVKLAGDMKIQKTKERKGNELDTSAVTPKKKKCKKKKQNKEKESSSSIKVDDSLNKNDKDSTINTSGPEEEEEESKSEIDNDRETAKHVVKEKYKKEKLKQLLQQSSRTRLMPNENNLRIRMLQKLKAAQFRYLNERLYTTTGEEARNLFTQDPSTFQAYHAGFQHQLSKWPINPLECIVKRINKMPKNLTVADMGCGDAALARRVAQHVRSFELVASAPGVEACDMARTPLAAASVDVAVYCLALMGTNLTEYLLEANRVLKMGGLMMIAEVESRFENVDTFVKEVQRLGFKLAKLDKTHKMFFFFDFKKVQAPPSKKGKLPKIALKPCLYKKR